ncbi:hypothetical protein FE236_00030 [Mariprofundus erugo]|nr:hypothetical protein FE236_00030 [Mariprofundus erugo]
MRNRRASAQDNFYEIFSDMSLLMLAAFVFLFAVILISARLQGSDVAQMQIQQLREKNQALQAENRDGVVHLQQALQQSEAEKKDLELQMQRIFQDQSERILETVGLGQGQGKKDFELFVSGLRKIPGKQLHLVVDATGSMHGVTTFLIPILRVIALRTDKEVSAISWYADNRTGTITGSMDDMLDQLIQQAPFVGAIESIGKAFDEISAKTAPPGAYLLIGDERPSDEIHYHQIPAPVFTLPLGTEHDASTQYAYQKLADATGGKMLQLHFK